MINPRETDALAPLIGTAAAEATEAQRPTLPSLFPDPMATCGPLVAMQDQSRPGHLRQAFVSPHNRGMPTETTTNQQRQMPGPDNTVDAPPLVILRRNEVLRRCGLKKSTLYLAMSENRFPKAVHLGPRAVGWLAHEIDEWIVKRITESRPHNDSAPPSGEPASSATGPRTRRR